jgi:hypothetical protein
MRKGMMLALLLATAAIGPAAAQPSDNARGGIPTETQDRLAGGVDFDVVWNLIGLAGLLGLLGLRKEHADDSYHPSSIE